MDLWARFLAHEKLDPKNMSSDWVLKLINLTEELVKRGNPKYRPYKDRLETRKLICETAMDLGIDLTGIKHKWKGKYMIGRGLLDMWNKVCIERYGSVYGTQSAW